MPRFIFGNGYDSVANQQNFYDNLNYRVANDDREAKQRADALAMQYAFERQRMDDAANARNLDNIFRASEAHREQGNRERAEANDLFKFNTEVGLRRAEDASRDKFTADDLGLRSRQYAFNRDFNQNQNDYNEAINAIESGAVKDPRQIATLFPKLNPNQLDRVNAYWDAKLLADQEARKGVESGGAYLNSLITQARVNKWKMGEADKLKKDTEGLNMPKFLFGKGTDSDLTKAYQERIAAGAPTDAPLPELSSAEADAVISGVRNPHVLRSLDNLQFDPAAQRFVPVMPMPKTRADYASPGQPAIAATPPDDREPAGTPRFSFPVPAVAPAAVTNAPVQMPRFRVGQKAVQNGVTYQFDGTNWNEMPRVYATTDSY